MCRHGMCLCAVKVLMAADDDMPSSVGADLISSATDINQTRVAISASLDCYIRIWAVDTGKILYSLVFFPFICFNRKITSNNQICNEQSQMINK